MREIVALSRAGKISKGRFGIATTFSQRRQTKSQVPDDAAGLLNNPYHNNAWRPIMAVKPVPDGYHTVTPYLTVRGAPKVIEFLKQAFGAELSHEPIKRPDGTIMHAQVKIGDSPIMIADESEMAKATPSSLYLYVPNVDSVYQRAVKAGGSTVMEPMDMFYGDRSGAVKDPSGNSWFIATHKEDVAPQELAKRADAFLKQQKGKAA
jgi:PhnB protein